MTGPTSNPAIFDKAIRVADFYYAAIRQKAAAGKTGEALSFDLELADLAQAADLQRQRTIAFARPWGGLMNCVGSKSKILTHIRQA